MTASTRSTSDSDLVKVAYAHDQAEAEFLQGLLDDADVGSVVRRAPAMSSMPFDFGRSSNVMAMVLSA